MRIVDSPAAGHEATSGSSSMSSVESSSRSHWDSSKNDQGKLSHTSSHSRNPSSRGANSASDPTVQASRGEKTTSSSNMRHHPKAELRSASNHNHASSKSHDRKRKHSHEDEEEEEGEDVWTEHKSSSGRIYFYNKRLDKSQWEKPAKGTVKKLKASDTRTPTRSQSDSHSSRTHSHSNSTGKGRRESGSHQSNSHHHHHHSEHHHTPKRKPADKKSTPSHSRTSKSLVDATAAATVMTSPVASTGKVSATVSPSSLPQTPTSRPVGVAGGSENLMVTSSHVMHPPYVESPPAVGPVTPRQIYAGGWSSSSTPGADGVHPLQRALLVQNQYSQGYQVSPRNTPSLPTTPLQTFPPVHTLSSNPVVTPQQQQQQPVSVVPVGYQGGVPVYRYQQQPVALPVSSQKLQVPMSRLGRWPQPEDEFPDPNSLQPLPQLPNNDFFSGTLVQQWSSSLETVTKQMDSAHLETLSRTTVDLSYHCGQLAKNLLALECCRMKTVSRRTRITDLTKTVDIIEKR